LNTLASCIYWGVWGKHMKQECIIQYCKVFTTFKSKSINARADP
jgi:hypothetical protein